MSIDPDENAKADYIMTSDEYFKNHKQKFEIIFIDGLHHNEQTYKDIINSLECLHKNGTIVVHDCNPKEKIHQVVPRISKVWNGDCWRAFVRLRKERDNLDMFVIDTDYGCGIIRKGEQLSPMYINEDITFENFMKYKKEWLNLISVEEFQQWLLIK